MNSPNKRKPASEPVSELTTNRLSVYLRCLTQLESAGVETISSQALADQFHLNAAQIRKDLAYFGEFGVRGVGYYVKDLKRHLRQILGLDRKLRVAVMGAGNLGLALADYPGFKREGFEIAAMFDVADSKIGDQSRSGVPIHDLRELKKVVRKERIDIAVIAVPAESAQHVLEQVVASHQGGTEFFSRSAEGAAGCQGQERRSDGVARKLVVLSCARHRRWLVNAPAR